MCLEIARKKIVYLFIIDKLIAHMCIPYDLVLNICINHNPKKYCSIAITVLG